MRFLVLFAVLISGCGWYSVDPGNVGVAINWSKVESWTYTEGFHWKSPIGMDVHEMSIRTQTSDMSGNNNIDALTKDQLKVELDVTVQFHLTPAYAPVVYRLFGDEYANNVIHPAMRTAIRDAVSDFAAVETVVRREELNQRMEDFVKRRISNTLRNRGINPRAIVIEDILLRAIDLPDRLEASIAAVQIQRQNGVEQQMAIETARQTADRNRMEATGQAAVVRIQAERDAAAILVRAHAQAEANREISSSLTPAVLRLRQIEAASALATSTGARTIVIPSDLQGMILGNLQ